MSGQFQETSITRRRALLVVQCACDLLGIDPQHSPAELHLPITVREFEQELHNRYGSSHAELVFRTDSTLERARLDRRGLAGVPRIVLRQGAPVRSRPAGRPHEVAGLPMNISRASG